MSSFRSRLAAARSFHLSPEAYHRVTLVALVGLCFIVVTGAAVRLTGSGLGCSDFPTCEQDQLVAPLEFHPMVEFVNRMITGLVSVAVILAVLGSLRRSPRRTDLVWLSVGLVAGVVGQIALGGLVVLFELWPPLVMGHFILSMVIVADAVVLHARAGEPDGPTRLIVEPEVRALSRWLVAAAGIVLLTGTVVTASGPHGGDESVERLPFFVPDVARIHGIAVMVFLAATLAMLWLLRRTDAPTSTRRRAQTLLTVLVAQATVGYTQYFTGVPELLVGVHIVGAVSVWVAVLWFHLGTRSAVSEPAEPAPERVLARN